MSFATVAHIPFDTLLNVAFDTMKEPFTAENRSSTPECAHSILPAASLHKATETSLLLALWRHIGWRGNDSSKAGMTAGAVGRSHWGHRQTIGCCPIICPCCGYWGCPYGCGYCCCGYCG